MDFRKADEAYLNDPMFHNLVDAMIVAIDRLEFTPSEVRQAAIYACYRHEARSSKPLMITKQALQEYFK